MIELKNVTKYFKTDGQKKYILKNVTLTIPSGVNLGIVGRNGAGKSTLLRMLGGIDFPTVGTITSPNSFSWPMGLAGGFQGSMTGRQNVKFVCRIYGKREEELQEVIEHVREFAEIGDYFDMPIKLYSSGMKSRLSFGLSLAFDFDYLIIDETLSVGDENFKKKAKDALMKKIERSNVLLVSHSMADLRKICDAGILIDDGKIFYYEEIDDAINAYHNINIAKTKKNGVASSAIYCSDGKCFDNINDAASFYKIRPMSIIQALNENNGSNVYLKKVFWRDGQNKLPFQNWENVVAMETLISSDGVIFENALEAAFFYMERFPKKNIGKMHVAEVMQHENGFSKTLNVKFYYLSEYQ
ncbi:ABC transporter ATP-binding protein [Sulfurimonas sediminis]|uniref:ABC transporter ATP-binding protein n=1 Tax=Sulfurimonas sediminis TaxID=2590020 RepID=A0A7M1AYV7_9BACT|nr:ABC transporter ATP-binding protein [Sulfurimonas sediminis]QOP42679.1 ABC transporter ATP-binding protein [Sulfurimonas sediminis]